MRVVRTPVKNQPSNLESRASRARSHSLGSSATPSNTSASVACTLGASDSRTTTSENGETVADAADTVDVAMSGRYFHGWNVVGATLVMALFSFGLGFYGV